VQIRQLHKNPLEFMGYCAKPAAGEGSFRSGSAGLDLGSTPPIPMPADRKNDPKPGKKQEQRTPPVSKESSPCFLSVFSLLFAFGEII
jgi:hypothetical protein